jgi:hypothetical protein
MKIPRWFRARGSCRPNFRSDLAAAHARTGITKQVLLFPATEYMIKLFIYSIRVLWNIRHIPGVIFLSGGQLFDHASWEADDRSLKDQLIRNLRSGEQIQLF